jgi:hypothetical protein
MFPQDRGFVSRSFLPVFTNDMKYLHPKNYLQTPKGGIVRLQYGCSKSPRNAFRSV